VNYRSLGASGLQVSPLCLGTMMFGGATNESTAQRIVTRAREQGVNFIDTADAYNGGKSEEIVGRAIRDHRSWWVLATKCANPTGQGPNARGLSRRHVFDAVHASLRRLGDETIDLLYLHKEDHGTPLAETVRALADLIRAGKIRYFGVSNYRSWRVAEICRLCDAAGIDRPIASQPLYNALNRQVEVEHLPACAYYGLGAVPYSPLARGVLTGKYAPNVTPEPDTRAGRRDRRMLESEWRTESLQIAREIAEHAGDKGVTPGQFAFAWVLNNRFVRSMPARCP
jgi:aryl-alcohol dehydrogenase-like predicted oxidoreductase